MKPKQSTYSVRRAVTRDEWLDSGGEWNSHWSRKRFKTQDEAEAFVVKHFGGDFQQYGIFPNSK